MQFVALISCSMEFELKSYVYTMDRIYQPELTSDTTLPSIALLGSFPWDLEPLDCFINVRVFTPMVSM